MIRGLKFLGSKGTRTVVAKLAFNRPPSAVASRAALHHLARVTTFHADPTFERPFFVRRCAVRNVFIQTENTPNPESIKFVPTNTIVLDNADGTGHFLNKTDPMEDILKSPLAKELFKIDGVKAVYFGQDFVTVTKFAEHKWNFLRPEIFSILMDFFENPNNKVLLDQPVITDTTILDDDDEVVAMIKELIEDRIRPAVQEDGGDIRYEEFDETTGIVSVRLLGSCVGCPSSSITLKQGVENMLMHYIPEVTAVHALDDDKEDNSIDGDTDAVAKDVKIQKTYEERLKAAGIPFSD
ncbi:Nfu/NifU scaffold protein [Nitzschia inconspicua]|uniref:Nfu/NifU scaffold protein n=1 Tax=Nitzschia inconspicua TaxID=303405 RepID=A0A9K3PTU2_9STRA|nr:Nfu/NifU scaffold protein [Nitzschia inconspicua]